MYVSEQKSHFRRLFMFKLNSKDTTRLMLYFLTLAYSWSIWSILIFKATWPSSFCSLSLRLQLPIGHEKWFYFPVAKAFVQKYGLKTLTVLVKPFEVTTAIEIYRNFEPRLIHAYFFIPFMNVNRYVRVYVLTLVCKYQKKKKWRAELIYMIRYIKCILYNEW